MNRSDFHVLVPQAESMGALAVVRSLGRAGYRVHAASTDAAAPALASRFAARAVVMPPYHHPSFLPWLRGYLAEQNIRAIIPSEGFILALGAARPEFLHLLPFVRDEKSLLAAMSKYALFEKLQGAPNLPPTLLVQDLAQLPAELTLRQLGAPLFLKLDGVHSRDHGGGKTMRAGTPAEARGLLEREARHFTRAVVQGFVPGAGAGVFFLRARGRVLAQFVQRRVHEVPHTGGVSSLREIVRDDALLADAREKLEALDWDGVAMFEYRVHAGGFALMELNARFWGSLHLALAAGADLPRMLVDAFRGEEVAPARARLGARCRNLPLEVQHVWSKLKDAGVSRVEKARSAAELLAHGFDPRVHSDLFFARDVRPALRALRPLARLLPVKTALYRAARAAGLFGLARRLTRKQLRIVAWHGFGLDEQTRFLDDIFVTEETLRARLAFLRREKYPVLPLPEAVRRLRAGTLPPCAVALTIDDGFASTREAAEILREQGMPAMVYVTTWYTARRAPVFRLALRSCFARTRMKRVELARLPGGLHGEAAVDDELLWELINFGESRDEPTRAELLRQTARALNVELPCSRGLTLLTPDEVRALPIDVQLHTHRHRLPLDPMRARNEIEENRRVLEPLLGRRLTHFCYPSGFCAPELFPVLEAAGIETATTCEAGLNDASTHPLALRRFLDGERQSELLLEAELSGFATLLRRLLRRKPSLPALTEEDRRRGYPAGNGRSLLERARESA